MSDVVGNREDQFSGMSAHIVTCIVSESVKNVVNYLTRCLLLGDHFSRKL